jgi:hypothetical protein
VRFFVVRCFLHTELPPLVPKKGQSSSGAADLAAYASPEPIESLVGKIDAAFAIRRPVTLEGLRRCVEVNTWRLEGYEEELRSVYIGYSSALDRFLRSTTALAEMEKQSGGEADAGSESDEE